MNRLPLIALLTRRRATVVNRFEQSAARLLCCLAAALVVCAAALPALAHPGHVVIMQAPGDETVIPPGAAQPGGSVKLVLPLRDNPEERVIGTVVWFDLTQVSYLDKDKAQLQINWDKLSAEHLPRFLTLLPDKRDAHSLLTVTELLIVHGGDERTIERLIGYALQADATVQDRVDALREKMKNGGGAKPGPGGEGDPPPADGGEGKVREGDGQPDIDNPRAWPELTVEEHAAAVAALQKSTDEVLGKMGHKMGSTQTERFLVYSDMPAKESDYWVSLLDKMYDRLCEVFDLDKQKNIWQGKCLLLFFNDERDYLKYNAAAYGNNATGSAGICYQFGNGDVHIAMFRQDEKLQLAHVLVHEATHGFLFRYMSSYYVPNWLNEGLAEYIAVSLARSDEYPARAESSRDFILSRGSLDNFLSARNIIGPHYGLAFDVTDMMVNENRKGYVKLIKGIKAGLSTEDAFNKEYGASIEKVFNYYAKSRLKTDKLRLD